MGSFASVSLARLTPSRHPKTRRLLRVEIADQIVTDRVSNELMGKNASAWFRLMNRAEEGQELDVWAESSSDANVTMVLR